jgi:acyl-homoserine-lactone acylase
MPYHSDGADAMSTKQHLSQGWLVGCACAAAFVVAGGTATAADPPALARQVQIRRTQYGVPHIKGESLEAAAFGFAYCQAEDHLQNIMRGILGVRGDLAATFGPGDDGQNVTADFFNRQFRVHARAVETYHKLDPDYRAMIEGFAAGLNFYVDRHRDDVPAWTPRVTGHDVAAYGISGVMRFAFNRNDLIKDFLKSQAAATARRMPDMMLEGAADESAIGSNMWAFAPSRSQSGHAMLMGNPHQPWKPVSTYYEAHMIVPDRLNIYGATYIGRPIITSGWNESLGWSHTVNAPDLEEIYELDLDAAIADHYLFDGGSVPLARDDVEIKVKSEQGTASQSRTFWHSPLGPVIHRTATKVYVLRSACYENYRAYEQWLRMSQTKNFAEFRQAVEMNAVPMFNICYADRVGNIFYIWNGTVPNLPHRAHKAEAVHASRTADVWTKFHATSELPQLVNPPGGYVQNCNSPPYLTNLQAPLDPAKYPAHFSLNDLSLRTQHSLRLVDNGKKLSLDDVCTLKHSPLMLLAERVKPDLIAALKASSSGSNLEAAIRALESWDDTVAAESRGGTLFANWWDRYYQKGVGKFAVAWSATEPMLTPRGLADRERAVATFHEAFAEVTSLYGRPDVSWVEVHRIRKGAVDLPVTGGSGLMGCFRVLEFHADSDGKLAANSGDSFVFAVEFSDPPRGYTNVAYSQSDVPSSPHFSDQASLFSANRLKPAAFTDAEIEAQLIKAYRPGEE